MHICKSVLYAIRSACTRYSTCITLPLVQMTAVIPDGMTHRSTDTTSEKTKLNSFQDNDEVNDGKGVNRKAGSQEQFACLLLSVCNRSQ